MAMFDPTNENKCKNVSCRCEIEFGDVYCCEECRHATASDECGCGHRDCRHDDTDFSSIRSRELVTVG